MDFNVKIFGNKSFSDILKNIYDHNLNENYKSSFYKNN